VSAPITGRIPPLLRGQAFRRYWSGQTISMFGDQISSIALPLVGRARAARRPRPDGPADRPGVAAEPALRRARGRVGGPAGHRRATMIAADIGRAEHPRGLRLRGAHPRADVCRRLRHRHAQRAVHGQRPRGVRSARAAQPLRRGQLAGVRQPRDVLRRRPERRWPAGAGADRAGCRAGRRPVLPGLGVFPQPHQAGRAAAGGSAPGRADGRGQVHPALGDRPLIADGRGGHQLLQLRVLCPVRAVRDAHAAGTPPARTAEPAEPGESAGPAARTAEPAGLTAGRRATGGEPR
jgi:hypothetical protein